MNTASLARPPRPPIRRIAWPFGVRATVDTTVRAHITPEPDIAPPVGPGTPDPGPDEPPVPVQDPPPVVPDPVIDPRTPPLHASPCRTG